MKSPHTRLLMRSHAAKLHNGVYFHRACKEEVNIKDRIEGEGCTYLDGKYFAILASFKQLETSPIFYCTRGMSTDEQRSIKLSGSLPRAGPEPSQGMKYGTEGAPDLCLRPVLSQNVPQSKGTSAAAPSASWRFRLSWTMAGSNLSDKTEKRTRSVVWGLLRRGTTPHHSPCVAGAPVVD